MKTEVTMVRTLFGMPIAQKSKTEFFSATDLVKAGQNMTGLFDRKLKPLPVHPKKQN